ncbi:unnamed protein product [Calypogeia fissa]
MEATALVSPNPKLDYVRALTHVSKKFYEEEIKGSSDGSSKSNNFIPFEDYGIDWEAKLAKDPVVYQKCTGGVAKSSNVSIGSNMIGNSFLHCSVTIKIVQPGEEDEKENALPHS